MFYDARDNDHGLPHDPFKALVGPRPDWLDQHEEQGGYRQSGPLTAFSMPLQLSLIW